MSSLGVPHYKVVVYFGKNWYCIMSFQSIKNTLFSIEPAFWATFPQALRSVCGKVDGSLAAVLKSTTVLCCMCCVAIYVGASFRSGSMYFSVGAAAGIGVL